MKVNININQIGYRPTDNKTAFFRSAGADSTFEVIALSSGKAVFSGPVTGSCSGGTSGDTVAYGDFTALTTPGRYCVRAKESGDSYPFTIAENVYDELLAESAKMLYLQRCGMELTPAYAGEFSHPACHTELATVYDSGEEIDVSGGWHDAGDYGRYVVPAAKTVADMLIAYEMNPAAFTDSLGIPESGNGVPDILDEARYELEWMLKMQRADGGVYHKVTSKEFDDFVMPEDCRAKLFVSPVSITASADFAGAMYMAARVYASVDPAFAARCAECAAKALHYYEDHMDDGGFTNPSDVHTGEYGDPFVRDEYLWALCEGFKTTQDSKLNEKIKAFDLSVINGDGLGWEEMAGYGYYAYLTSQNTDEETAKKLREAFFRYVDYVMATIRMEAYRCSTEDEYLWGSNMYIADNAVMLLMAEELTGDSAYRAAAQTQLDYLLGANTTSYCFFTGFGSFAPHSPHHRPSVARGLAMKGMLVGGPNNGLLDPCAVKHLTGLPKAACYVDSYESYSCNEICIYWNSPVITLLAGLLK